MYSSKEVDVILDAGKTQVPIEIKSGQTVNTDFFRGLKYWREVRKVANGPSALVHGGDGCYRATARWSIRGSQSETATTCGGNTIGTPDNIDRIHRSKQEALYPELIRILLRPLTKHGNCKLRSQSWFFENVPGNCSRFRLGRFLSEPRLTELPVSRPGE